MGCLFYESHRLASFQHYSGSKPVIQLARKGYYWQNEDKKVACYRCNYNTSDNWELLDDVQNNHKQFLHDCPVAVENDPENKPMNLLAEQLERIFEKYSGSNNPKANHSWHQDAADCENDGKFMAVCRNVMMRARKNGVIVSISNSQPLLIDLEKPPNYELMKSEQYRLATFETWPSNPYVTRWDLAKNGLFYTGKADRVQCAFCRGFLFGWEQGDVVSVEHKKHFPNCPFVRGSLVENDPIRDGRPVNSASSLSLQMGRNTTQFQESSLERDGEDRREKNDAAKKTSGNNSPSTVSHVADYGGPASYEDEPARDAGNQSPDGGPVDEEEIRNLLEENQQLREIRTCKICLDKEVNIVFLPCGHLVSCEFCAPELRTCAVCRAVIRGTVRVAL